MREGSPYRRVLRYFPAHRRALLAGAGAVVASRGLMVWAPLLLRDALNALERGGPETVARATRAGWTFLAVSAAAGLFTWAQRRLLIGASRHVERKLKADLFAHVERLPIATFDRMRTGDLLSRLTSDIEAVRWIVGPGPMYISSTLVLFPLTVWAMFRLSTPVTLATLAPLLSIMVVVRLLAPSIMRLSRVVQDRVGDLSARAQESFAGARVVRAYATEDVEIAAFERENRRLVTETVGLARRRAVLTASLFLLGGLGELVVLLYGGNLLMEGRLGLGELGAFMAYVGMLIWPMISVGWVVSALQRANAAIQRIDDVLSEPAERSHHGKPAASADPLRGDIRAQGLTFAYAGGTRPALEDVSFALRAGGTLAVVGPVGSGKSTLLALLTRTYEPPAGSLFVDDVDVTTIPLERLRAAFAVVPQDAFLFSDTIAGNLSYGLEGPVPRERLHAAAGVAGLETDLAAFPRGLDTVVGERGVTLSGGQKQRATLARALLRDAPVLLLDDALSSVDTHTEARILERLESEMRRRTVIITAHRLSTIRHADHILVLQEGRVVEAGTHAELVSSGGWYARTYANQRLEAELEDLR